MRGSSSDKTNIEVIPLSKFRDTEHLQLGKDDARLEAGEFQTHCASSLHFISSLSTVIFTY